MARKKTQVYRVVQPMRLLAYNHKSFTPDTGDFTAEDVDDNAGKAKTLIDRWIKDGDVKSKTQIAKEQGFDVPAEPAAPKTPAAPKGAQTTKIWTVELKDLAALNLEELNLKVAEMAADNKVEAPKAFEDAVEAINFLTQDVK